MIAPGTASQSSPVRHDPVVLPVSLRSCVVHGSRLRCSCDIAPCRSRRARREVRQASDSRSRAAPRSGPAPHGGGSGGGGPTWADEHAVASGGSQVGSRWRAWQPLEQGAASAPRPAITYLRADRPDLRRAIDSIASPRLVRACHWRRSGAPGRGKPRRRCASLPLRTSWLTRSGQARRERIISTRMVAWSRSAAAAWNAARYAMARWLHGR